MKRHNLVLMCVMIFVLFIANISAQTTPALMLDIAWSRDGVYVAAAVGDSVYIYRSTDGSIRYVLSAHTATVEALDWSSNAEYLVTTSTDGTVRFWSMATGENIRTLSYEGGSITTVVLDLAWNPTNDLIALRLDPINWIHIYDFSADAVIRIASGPSDGRLMASTDIIMWDPSGEKLIFDTDGENGFSFYDVATAAIVDSISDANNLGFIENAALQSMGNLIASVGSELRIWDIGLKQIVNQVQLAPSNLTHSVSWSADGQFVAVGLSEGKVMVYALPNLVLVEEFQVASFFAAIAFSPMSNQLAYVDEQLKLRFVVPSQ